MNDTVNNLLKKINYIEADMDLHRQILASIPSRDTAEMERVVGILADQKKQIQALRHKIREADEGEYNKMIAIEKAAENFKQLARTKNFVTVNTMNAGEDCCITLVDGTRIECLVAAKEENGNWTILTLDGEIKEYPSGIIRS